MARNHGYPGIPIGVETDERGYPVRFFVGGQSEEVVQILDHWRVDLRWGPQGPIHATGFELITEKGVHCVVYRNDETQKWYLEVEYD